MLSKGFINRLLTTGLIKKQAVNFDQITQLLTRAKKDLKTAHANLKIDEEAAYTFAYLAMLRSGRALLFLKGFRPSERQQHKTVVNFAGVILGEDYKNLVKKFDSMRRKRNRFTYDLSISVSMWEASNALKTAGEFVKKISDFIKKENPQMEFKV